MDSGGLASRSESSGPIGIRFGIRMGADRDPDGIQIASNGCLNTRHVETHQDTWDPQRPRDLWREFAALIWRAVLKGVGDDRCNHRLYPPTSPTRPARGAWVGIKSEGLGSPGSPHAKLRMSSSTSVASWSSDAVGPQSPWDLCPPSRGFPSSVASRPGGARVGAAPRVSPILAPCEPLVPLHFPSRRSTEHIAPLCRPNTRAGAEGDEMGRAGGGWGRSGVEWSRWDGVERDGV